MGYDISLHKLPNRLKKEEVNEDDLFEIANKEEFEEFCIRYTNFSLGNKKALDFAEVFEVVVTNNDYFKFYLVEDYKQTKVRLQNMTLDKELLGRINLFLKDIEDSLDKGEDIFFYCG